MNQFACQPASGCDADLLTQHRTYGDLKAVPASWRSKPRTLCDQIRQRRIRREVSIDRFNVGAEVKQAANPGHDGGQGFDAGESNADSEALLFGQMRHGDASHRTV